MNRSSRWIMCWCIDWHYELFLVLSVINNSCTNYRYGIFRLSIRKSCSGGISDQSLAFSSDHFICHRSSSILHSSVISSATHFLVINFWLLLLPSCALCRSDNAFWSGLRILSSHHDHLEHHCRPATNTSFVFSTATAAVADNYQRPLVGTAQHAQHY